MGSECERHTPPTPLEISTHPGIGWTRALPKVYTSRRPRAGIKAARDAAQHRATLKIPKNATQKVEISNSHCAKTAGS